MTERMNGGSSQNMGIQNGYELSLNGTALNSFKLDFNNLLTRTIRTMQDKGVEDATITAKIEINLTTEGNPNLNAPGSDGELEYTAPKFKHKVTASMQVKREASGETGGKKFELRWDAGGSVFVMVPVADKSQTSLFDVEAGKNGGNQDSASERESETLTGDNDPQVRQAVMIVRSENAASVGLIQRRMNVSFTKAKELLDALERQGVVGPFNGARPREVLPWDVPDDASPDSAEDNAAEEDEQE